MSRTYIDGKVTLVADIFDDLMEAALALDAARARPDEAGLRAKIEALPEMVGEPTDGGWSLVRRSDVLAALSQPAVPVAGAEGPKDFGQQISANNLGLRAAGLRAAQPEDDGLDRHEGPTPRDCPECERLHEGVERRDGA